MTKYRKLKLGEVIRYGDQCQDYAGAPWKKITKSDNLIGQANHVDAYWLRRPLKTKEARKPASNKQRATCPHCGRCAVKSSIIAEARELQKAHPSKDCRAFAQSVLDYFQNTR